MPSPITAPLLVRRGTGNLSLKQMADIVGKEDEITAILKQFDEIIEVARMAQRAADESISTLAEETDAANAAIAEREEALARDVDKHIEELTEATARESKAAKDLEALALSLTDRAEAVIADEKKLAESQNEFVAQAAAANKDFTARDTALNERAEGLEQRAAELELEMGLVRAAEARNVQEAERLSTVGARVQEAFAASPAEMPIDPPLEPVADA